jgi:hypothetical protein
VSSLSFPLVSVSGCVFARYAPVPGQPGAVQVVSSSGAVLAPSFFELRDRFSFVCALSGSGGWVALRSSSFLPPASAAAVQPALF